MARTFDEVLAAVPRSTIVVLGSGKQVTHQFTETDRINIARETIARERDAETAASAPSQPAVAIPLFVETAVEHLSLDIADAVMGNPTIEAVFGSGNPEADGFKADIQIEAARVLRMSAQEAFAAGPDETAKRSLDVSYMGDGPHVGAGPRSAEQQLTEEILAELTHARTKFPGKNVTFAALVEEVGELATATFSESRDRVRKEAVQVALMAMRMVLDGDHTFDNWRSERDLDPLTESGS